MYLTPSSSNHSPGGFRSSTQKGANSKLWTRCTGHCGLQQVHNRTQVKTGKINSTSPQGLTLPCSAKLHFNVKCAPCLHHVSTHLSHRRFDVQDTCPFNRKAPIMKNPLTRNIQRSKLGKHFIEYIGASLKFSNSIALTGVEEGDKEKPRGDGD